MEHADTAQLAAVGGALGSVLVLLARGRVTLLAGLRACWPSPRPGWRCRSATPRWTSSRAPRARRRPSAGLLLLGGGAALLRLAAGLVPVAVLLAAPFRPPLDFSSSNRFLVSIAEDGRLGRLLPLYFVLAAAAGALGWRALRGRPVRALPPVIALPGRGVLRARVPVAAVGGRRGGRHQPARVLHAARSRCCWPRSPAPTSRDFVPRALAAVGARRWHRCSPWWGCGRWPPTSCSSSRPTWRCRTPTPTTSASRRCSATRACTGATWCSASAWRSRCWRRTAGARGR